MAVSFVAQASDLDTFDPSRTVNKPGGVVIGDVAVFFLLRWDSGGSFPAVDTTPGNAVELTGSPIVNSDVETRVYAAYVGVESSYTFSWGGDRWSSLTAVFFAGVDAGLNLAALPFDSATGSGTAIATTAVTTVADAGLAWNDNTHGWLSGGTHTPPTGFTEVVEADATASAYLIAPGGGSQSAAGASHAENLNWIAVLAALAPAGGGGATVEGAATVALGGLTLTATGHRVAHGIADLSLGGLTLAATGRRTVHSSAALTLGGLDLAAVGVVEGITVGTVDLTLGGLAFTAAGKRVAHGIATIELGGLTLTAIGTNGVLAAIIVGAVDGPSRHVDTVTGPMLRRELTGPEVRRELTGPQLESTGVDGPSRHVDDVEGPELSRVLTGPDVARVLTGAGA